MKILLLTSTFKSNSDRKIPEFVLDQTLSISKKNSDIKFHVLSPHDEELKTQSKKVTSQITLEHFHYIYPNRLETINYFGIWPTIQSSPVKALLIPFMVFFFLFKSIRVALKEKPDIIYAHWFTPQGIVAYLTSIITGTPFLYTSHSSDVWILRKLPFIGKFIVRKVTKRAAQISVVSKRTLNKLKYFFSESEWHQIEPKTHIIPMGTHLPTFSLGSKNNNTSVKKDIVFIGRLAEKKGLQYLIPAFDRLSTKHPEFTLKIAGTGPYGPYIKSLISQCKNHEKIKLLGHIEGAQKENLIRNCFCFIVPSIITDSGDAEGLPVSLLEGLSFGKICIATRESGADDILEHEKNGFLIKQKDVNSIHNALEWVVNLPEDAKIQISEHALSTSKNYGWEVIAQKYEDFFRRTKNEKSSFTKQ